ncbi:type VI secretion system tip protein VgrG [Burkholderia dolosa]|uniref:type VI secretion system Vgr family protein n=1 Tax=Burkholderia dolosa TaxID=152500 RepID=UPI001B8DDD46|nr:type VI secretion system Vgr family protein [Burkholderia dolosa]MBR8458688.1 type VI secretion system tip protein VgrG [Burkholderia dolosa]MDN7422866.1 type VI secretion system Vgr family protein [Burkholderia dolosa]
MNVTELAQAIPGGLIQQGRLLKTDIPALPNNALVPRRAVTRSELGRDFSVVLDLVSTASDVELKTLIAQPITLWIQQTNKSYLPINGYIHTARRLGTDGSLATYQLSFASWMHFLRFRSDMRYWQEQPIDAILADVFDMHPQARGQYRFALSKPLPSRSYCRQSETDWNFVHRLMEDEGLFGFWRHGEDGKSHTFVITDDLHAIDALSPNTVSFDRFGSGTETGGFTQWAASRTLQSTLHTTRTFDYKSPSSAGNPNGTSLPTKADQGDLPAQAEIYEYTGAYTYPGQDRGEQLSKIRLEEWESRAKRFFGVGGVRGIDAGRRFTLTDHPEHDRDAASERQFAAIGVTRYIENNLPVSEHEASFPHSLQDQLAQVKAGRGKAAAFEVGHDDGSAGFYLVEVEAQRASVPYRSPFEHRKPAMQLETAIVVGPKGEEVYTDELNRIKVMFMWDRQSEGRETASCWMRVVQSDTGGGYGGVHIPRVGEEVLIGYIGGDCDRPIVMHRVYNGAAKPQWHSDGILSGFRTKEYAGAGHNEMVLDDATGQNRARLFSSSANSLLHLGYLIEQNGNTRGAYLGSGFDLRTDAYGAMRAGQGLYVTTHLKQANSQPLDVGDAKQQLANAEGLVESMSQVSEMHQAESLGTGRDALKQLADATQHSVAGATAGGGRTGGGGTGNANAFKEPVMLFASPAGIGVASQQSVHLASEQQTNIVSGQSTFITSGKSLIAGIRDRISLFAQNAGMKLFAGKGKVEVQAHADNVELTAQKTVKILSATEKTEIAAAREILLTSGGAYIRIGNGNIEIHAPGRVDVKGSQHSFAGPARLSYPLPDLPQSSPATFSQKVLFRSIDDGESVSQVKYSMFSVSPEAARRVVMGVSSDEGSERRVNPAETEHLTVLYGQGEWSAIYDFNIDRENDGSMTDFRQESDTGVS